jgi:hypothetical protein
MLTENTHPLMKPLCRPAGVKVRDGVECSWYGRYGENKCEEDEENETDCPVQSRLGRSRASRFKPRIAKQEFQIST